MLTTHGLESCGHLVGLGASRVAPRAPVGGVNRCEYEV